MDFNNASYKAQGELSFLVSNFSHAKENCVSQENNTNINEISQK